MKRPKFNWKITVPISSIVILAAIGFGLFFIGKIFAADILNELVRRESKGYYKLDFEGLDLNVFKKRITVNNLKLSPDTTKNFEELGLTNLYEMELGQLLIDFESIYGFYFDKELDINNVRIVDPYINMVKVNDAKTKKFSLEAGDLYRAISDYLEVLKIDYFHIQDGALDYSQNDFSLGNIDFVIKNLMMDSAGRKNNVFYSEAIELEIRNQKFNLPDGIHTLTFESFLLSTKDSILTFKNFQLMPLQESGVSFEGNNDVNVYNIKVPELSLRGIDYVAAYQENRLRVEELILKEPTVFIDDESHAEQPAKEDDNSIMALIFNVFNSLEVGKLTIDQAHIDLKMDGQNKYQRFKAKETNVQVYEIKIDSSNYRFHTRHEYFEDLILDIHNYQYFLPDSVHIADFSLLRVNTFTNELALQNLNIAPVLAHDSEFPTIEAHIPVLGVFGVDFRKALLDKRLVADTISVFTSKLLIENSERKKDQSPFDMKGIYMAIRPLFESVRVERFLIRGRKLDPSEALHLGEINLNLKGLRLNEITTGWTDLIQTMDLKVENFKLDQDSLKINGSSLNGSVSDFDLIDWRVAMNTTKQKINGHIDTVRISGVTIDSVLNGKVNYFTKVEVIRPNFEFDLASGGSNRGFEDHVEKEIIISDGTLRGTFDDWTFAINKLDTDVFEGDSTAFRSLESSNIFLQNDSLNHRIKMGRWNYDTLGGEMDFHEISVVPLRNDSSKSLISAFIPFVGLKDFEQVKFFNENHLILSQLKVIRPDLKLFFPQTKGQNTKNGDSSLLVNIQNILLDSGNFQVASKGSDVEKITVRNSTISLSRFDYPGAMITRDKLLFSDNVSISIDQITPKFTSGLQMDILGFQYSSDVDKLVLDTISISKHENFNTTLSNAHIEGLDMTTLNENGSIIAKDIRIGRIEGQNSLTDSAQQRGEFNFTKTLSIDKIDFPQIQWSIIAPDGGQTYRINKAFLELSEVRSKDTLKLHHVINRIRKFRFGGEDFELDVGSGYSVGVEKYELNHPEHSLDLRNVSLKSEYTKEDYSYIIGTQSDWFDVTVERVTMLPKSLNEILTGKAYRLGLLDMHELNGVIYRDKTIPMKTQDLKSLPQAELRKLKFPLIIDSLKLSGNLAYQEMVENGTEAGEITFEDFDLSLANIRSQVQDEREVMRLRAEGMLMGAGRFEVMGQFQMFHPDDRFSLSGSLSDFPLDSLNRMLVPVANVRINKGFANQLSFAFTANDTLAQGEMRFKYNDLRVRILNAKALEKGRKGGGIKSFFANTFVVKRKNPTFLFLRKGTIFYQRDREKAIFNYWAKALLSGAVSSVGIHKSDKQEKKFEKELDALKED